MEDDRRDRVDGPAGPNAGRSLSAAALSRGLVSDLHSAASSVGTVLVFCFGALALWWLVRFLREGEEEREELRASVAEAEKARAVQAERAEAAARLHDSVLQSLAAISRAESVERARSLAQESSARLRTWIRTQSQAPDSFRRELERRCRGVAGDREVSVAGAGDRRVDDRTQLLVEAAVEAVRNAVKHTDGPVRVYAETAGKATMVWVADRGRGFDPDSLPPDRLGVRESIVGRLERAGGTAELRSGPEGSEWTLTLPARPPAPPDA